LLYADYTAGLDVTQCFADAQKFELALGRLTSQRILLFSGWPVQDDRLIYAERTSAGLVVVSADEHVSEHGLTVLHAENLLCGLADRRNQGLGLAIIRKLAFTSGKLSLWTPVAAAQIRIIQFGNDYLSPDGCELNHKQARPR
jgi:polynucleotide 5'-kinase involved in rRNA processing